VAISPIPQMLTEAIRKPALTPWRLSAGINLEMQVRSTRGWIDCCAQVRAQRIRKARSG